MDRMGQEIAFKGIDTTEGYIPAFTFGAGQMARLNFGQVGFVAFLSIMYCNATRENDAT